MLSNGDGKQRLVEEWSEDEVTFVPDAKKKKKKKVKRQGGDGWCIKCVTEAKASSAKMGACEVRSCPGYKGQLPSARPQGDRTTDHTNYTTHLFPL